MKTWIALTVCALFAVPAAAGTGIDIGGERIANPLQPATVLKGLLDPARFDMDQTVGMSVGTGGSGFSQYYLNSMTYQASEKVTINATLGVHNQAYGTGFYGSSTGGASFVVPNVSVIYQLKPNMRIEIGFSNVPRYDRLGWGRW